jgi:hypothetical protein
VCCVSLPGRGDLALLKSTSSRAASQVLQVSADTRTRWAFSKQWATTLHLLQATFHLGPEVGSSTRTPLSHSTHWPIPSMLSECWQVGCVHSLQPMPGGREEHCDAHLPAHLQLPGPPLSASNSAPLS